MLEEDGRREQHIFGGYVAEGGSDGNGHQRMVEADSLHGRIDNHYSRVIVIALVQLNLPNDHPLRQLW